MRNLLMANMMQCRFCGRVKPKFPGMEVAYLPFSKDICKRVAEVLQIHGSISRVINRSARATFIAQRTANPDKSSPLLREFFFTWSVETESSKTWH